MEARLAVALAASSAPSVSSSPSSKLATAEPALPPVPALAARVATEGTPVSSEETTPGWPDEAAESAFRAEARERGETVIPPAASEAPEVIDPKSLPSLDSLVQRIPGSVRETLEDLFRARFVKVDRVSAKSLKG